MKKMLGIVAVCLFITGTPAFAGYSLIVDGGPAMAINPLQGTDSAQDFYNYRQNNGHWKWSGDNSLFEKYVSSLFLYEGSDGVSLFMQNHIRHTDGNENWINVEFDISGAPTGAGVLVSDDSGELTLTKGDWRFHNNSDGGVIGYLPTDENWCITINPVQFELRKWQYLDGNNGINLTNAKEVQICHTVPAPGALVLGVLGTTCVGWIRRKRLA